MPAPSASIMTSADIRRAFIDFFVQRHAHSFVPSSPVVPHDDPTLLFANAGMNQFKPYFLGTAKAPWKRIANTQKCIRAGGKHNDLDDVGRSRRHHTFFEMLGNWSIGDYFKQGAIEMAWELLTGVFKLDPRILHASCYEGDLAHGIPRDTQAADIWRKVANWEQYGLRSDDHIHYFGKDNFWEMGDTGPCGPCTEIYIDRRPESEVHADASANRRAPVNGNDPRVMEIWNLVFIQYNRDAAGKLTTLPAQHVDTGMGLERLCQVLQNVDDNYATDLFTPLFDLISQISNLKYTGQFPPTNAADPALEAANAQLRIDIAFRVIADHVRCLTFALTDGAVPSNEGRGYVLRRILRRAVRFGRQQLGLAPALGPGNDGAFLYKLVPIVVETMGAMFPELKKDPQRVMDLIKDEEISFGKTLDRGIQLFEEAFVDAVAWAYCDYLNDMSPAMSPHSFGMFRSGALTVQRGEASLSMELPREITFRPSSKSLDGISKTVEEAASELRQNNRKLGTITANNAFRLYDTYGFPIDLTRIMAEERGMTVDLDGYEKLMDEARERSRLGGKEGDSALFDLPPTILDQLHRLNIHPTDDSHKFQHGPTRVTVRAIWNGTRLEQSLSSTDLHITSSPGTAVPGPTHAQCALILDKTNFYAEMGGQVGDAGELRTDQAEVFQIETTRAVGPYILHIGHLVRGDIRVGDTVTASVSSVRQRTEKNHTSTHLANWALRETLGDHVQQKGSLVDPDKLRFDFLHQKAMTDDEIGKVESLVNACIEQKMTVYTDTAPQEKALKIFGLRAIFGEKYPPNVRVVSIGVPVADLLADPANPKWKAYSIEFCGGTHLASTALADRFVITAEEAVGKGIRRIVALTGRAAHDAATHSRVIESLIAAAKTIPDSDLPTQIAALQKAIAAQSPPTPSAGDSFAIPLRTKRAAQTAIADLQDRHKQWQRSHSTSEFSTLNSEFNPESLLASAESVNGVALIIGTVPNASADTLRSTWDWLKRKHPQQNLAVFLASEFIDTDKDGNKLPPKANLLAAVGDPLVNKLKAGDWIKAVAPIVNGSGGGRPQLAMAGGKDTSKIPAALDAAKSLAHQKLAT